MNKYLILLISLLIRVVVIAQPASTENIGSRSANEPATTETTPGQMKLGESPIYIKVYGLYGLLTPGVQTSHSELQSPDGTVFTFKTTTKGLGAGPRVGIGLGYIVNDFINLGIDAEILLGTDLKIENSYVDGNNTYGSTSTTSLKVLSVVPNITFKALSRPSYYIYNRLGLVGGIVLDYKQVDSGSSSPKVGINTTSVSTSDYTQNSLALGYQAALGIQFRLSQNLRGFAEVVAYNQSFKPEKLELTRTSTSAGKVTSTAVTTTEFKRQGSSIGASKTQTGQQQLFNVPMNSVGVGAGITFRF